MKMDVRAATAEDYDALCALFDEVDTLHLEHLPQLFQKPAGPIRTREYYQGLLADENIGLFVAEMDGRLIGYIHAVITNTPPMPFLVPRRYATVDNIGVKSGLRRYGIGSTLMHRIDEWAIAKGATAIELSVYEFNEDALAFYQKLGYDTVLRKMSKSLDKERAG